jgi:hypothetical protein
MSDDPDFLDDLLNDDPEEEEGPLAMHGGRGMRGPRITVTAKQAKERRMALSQLLINGVSHDEIAEAMGAKFQMTSDEVATLIPKVLNQLKAEYDESSPFHKQMASRRLHGHIIEARKARQYSAVANLESQLSKIQGTESPTEQHLTIDARLQQATLQVLGQLTPAQVNDLVAEELRQLGPTVQVEATPRQR